MAIRAAEPLDEAFGEPDLDWVLDMIHEIAHSHSGDGAACLYLPPTSRTTTAPEERPDLCPSMTRELSAALHEALVDAGVDVAELAEPARLFFPALMHHAHVLVLPLGADQADGTVGAFVVAARTPPLGKAGLGRVAELAAQGVTFARASSRVAHRLVVECAERARLDGELARTLMFLELQETLVGARTTAAVVEVLAEWLGTPVIVQMPNLIVSEAAGHGARELALSPDGDKIEQQVITRSTSEGRFPLIPATSKLPARVVAPITGTNGEFAGFLVAAAGQRGHDATRRALSVSSGLIAYQMAVRQDIEASVASLRQALLSDALEKQVGEHLTTRAAKLGHDLTAAHIPIAVSTSSPVHFEPAASRLARIVEQASAQASASNVVSLVGVVGDMVMGFVPEPLPAGSTALADAVVQEAARDDLRVLVGIGPRSESAADMSAAAARARWAVQVLRTTEPSGGRQVTEFESLGVYGLLFDHERGDELVAYANRWLGPLLEYDRRHRSELVETLRQLFRQRSLSDAAAALHIHISTLKYRIGRIEDILGMSVDDWDNVFHLELAIRLLAVADHLGAARAVAS